MAEKANQHAIVLDETVKRGGHKYRRIVARTPWINRDDDLAEVIKKALGNHLKKNDGTVFVAEKIAIVTNGTMVSASSIKVGWLARVASKFVRPIGEDLAQSIPERMQFVIDRIGYPRTLLACASSALTKPFGVRGVFFIIAGSQARDLDGMHGEYNDWLLPPLRRREAQELVEMLAVKIGTPVAIADVNDRGGHIRAVSHGGLSEEHLMRALKDNPHGHKATSTPMGVIELIADK